MLSGFPYGLGLQSSGRHLLWGAHPPQTGQASAGAAGEQWESGRGAGPMPQAQAGRTHGFESPSPWSVEAGTPPLHPGHRAPLSQARISVGLSTWPVVGSV